LRVFGFLGLYVFLGLGFVGFCRALGFRVLGFRFYDNLVSFFRRRSSRLMVMSVSEADVEDFSSAADLGSRAKGLRVKDEGF
jgi:hypothetical protein